MRLDEQMIHDHARLEALFGELLNAAEGADQPTVNRAWTEFEAGVLAHFDAEERFLLPRFEKKSPDAVRTIKREHEQIRKLIGELGIHTDLHLLRHSVAEELVKKLREHAANETRTLYPWAEESTTEADKTLIVETLVEEAKRRASEPPSAR